MKFYIQSTPFIADTVGTLKIVVSSVRVHNSGSLFHSKVCNKLFVFAGDLAAVRFIELSVIAGCLQGKS